MMGFGLIGIVLLIIAVFYFSKNSQNFNFGSDSKENAIDILKKRFANGEISKEEFEEKKRILT